MITFARVFAAAALAAVLAATQACAPPIPVEGEGEGDGGEGEGPPELLPCEENGDCDGGELCDIPAGDNDGLCREVCESDDDCGDDFYDTCDVVSGFCVQCAGAINCRNDEACVDNLCVFFCANDGDCDGGEFCDEATGACREAECQNDDDCRGGFACDDFRCVSILPVICDADAVICRNATTVSTCNADGTAEDLVTCDVGEACVTTAAGGVCATIVCAADEIGCDDDSTAFVCNANGTERELLPCRSDQYCDAGACRTRVCTPDSIVCAGDSRVICDETGGDSVIEPCGGETNCLTSDFGCSCRAVEGTGTCIERICAPGIGQCVGNGVRVCNDDGSGFTAVVNCGADDCIEGRCLSNVCTANDTFCAGDTLLTCEADGTGYRATTCAETCSGRDGEAVCVNQVCDPRTARCDPAAGEAVLTCNDRGTAETRSPCVDGFCSEGICRPEVCEPDTRRCASARSALVCDDRGTSESVVNCAADETCQSGVCVDTACVPQCGTRECGVDAVCGVSCGQCDAGDTCNNDGRCIAPTPTSGKVMRIRTSWVDSDTLDFDTFLSRTPAEGMCALDTCYVGTCVSGDPLRPDWDNDDVASNGDPVAVFSADGEESVTLTLPVGAQTYRLGVLYDSTDTTGAQAAVQLQVFVDDVEIDQATKFLRPRDLWDGTTLSWNGTRVTMTDSTRTQADFFCDPTPGSCTGDVECPAGQFCDGDNFLFPGTCVVGCRDDTECNGAEVCRNGTCGVGGDGGVGDVCTTDPECIAGLECGAFTGTCAETCTASLCIIPGFFGCCELTFAAGGTGECNNLGFCQ